MKRKHTTKIIASLLLMLMVSSCTVIRPGNIAFKQRLGKLKRAELKPGPHLYNPFVTRVLKINVRTVEIYEVLPLPTKEGLSVKTEITLLYHVDPSKADDVYIHFGMNYEEVIVKSNFLATAREISSRFYAKELYAIEREKVEKAIAEQLREHLEPHGFVVDAVLLKDIILPPAMLQAIQNKVVAEQAALQMEFVIQKQKKEAERLAIESEGIKKSQLILDSSITPELLQYYQVQVLKELVNSPNAKVIIMNGNGNTPAIINTDK
ncbi:MAG: prohibitin family protein [Bacteroidetes bacterium]|nr:prohibitin family protein [Bacteroidota bacterium]